MGTIQSSVALFIIEWLQFRSKNRVVSACRCLCIILNTLWCLFLICMCDASQRYPRSREVFHFDWFNMYIDVQNLDDGKEIKSPLSVGTVNDSLFSRLPVY